MFWRGSELLWVPEVGNRSTLAQSSFKAHTPELAYASCEISVMCLREIMTLETEGIHVAMELILGGAQRNYLENMIT